MLRGRRGPEEQPRGDVRSCEPALNGLRSRSLQREMHVYDDQPIAQTVASNRL